MSDSIKNIFNEYTRLRLNGLDATEAVRALHSHVRELDADMRDELARILRAWESQRTKKIPFVDRETLTTLATTHEANTTLACPACGKLNPYKEQICYSCGSLITEQNNNETDILPSGTKEFSASKNAHFGQNSILILIPEHDDKPYTLRPQLKSTGLTLGRNKKNTDTNDVDVDLERTNVVQRSVSRLHATITYDEASETLSLFDMSSTNGSFINGQKLQAKERRVIRQGDELRFGRLNFRVIYKFDN